MLGYIFSLVFNIILMLLITLVVASLTLMERKVLSLVQRRVGPNFVGYRGRLQYIADALKLLLKSFIIPNELNNFWYVFVPSFASLVCYSFWVNSIWGPNLSIFEIEYNIVYASLLSLIFSLLIILTGYFSKNKYSILGSIRCAVLTLNLEIFLGLVFLNVVLLTNSFSFSSFVYLQESIWFIFIYFYLSGFIVLVFLLETNRAPFDLPEAESELVSGYNTEYGSFLFAVYYLGEYFHLFFFSLTIVIIFFGGWELPNWVYVFFSKKYLI